MERHPGEKERVRKSEWECGQRAAASAEWGRGRGRGAAADWPPQPRGQPRHRPRAGAGQARGRAEGGGGARHRDGPELRTVATPATLTPRVTCHVSLPRLTATPAMLRHLPPHAASLDVAAFASSSCSPLAEAGCSPQHGSCLTPSQLVTPASSPHSKIREDRAQSAVILQSFYYNKLRV